MNFQVGDHEIDAHTHVVELQGELDLYTAPEFKDRLHEVIDAGKTHVVVDLSQAPFIDSTGLGVLVSGLKRLKRGGGGLVIVSDNPHMLQLFEITGLEQAMPIYASRAEALAAVESADEVS